MRPFDWTQLFTGPYRVFTQLLFWVIVFFLYIILKEYPQRMTGMALICIILQEMLELVIPCYTQTLLVLPLFKRRRWFMGILIYAVQLLLLITLLPYFLNAVGRLFVNLFHITDVVSNWQEQHFAFSMVAFTVIASIVKLGVDRLIRDKEQRENELRHLKEQLNPHFLFNTLNNLYGLSVTGSDKLPELMLKLSELMRYSLYDTGQHYVALQKEVDYIASYVELERIRLSNNTDIQLHIQADTMDHFVAPLLMIVFIENAFKHFMAARGETAFIHILLSVQDSKLRLNVKNSIDPDFIPSPSARPKGSLGIGNARRRLGLIYPGQHSLAIDKSADHFETNLIIELT